MKPYRFHEGAVPPGYHFDFEGSLFNQEAHRVLQSPKGWHSFYILNDGDKKIYAAIHFHVEGTIAKSPLRSPFGSIEFSTKVLPGTLFQFITFFEDRLKTIGVTRIIIKNPPQAYFNSQSEMLSVFFFNSQYRVSCAEISSIIEIAGQGFTSALHLSEKKRLRKAYHEGFIFKEIPLSDFDAVFSFIEACRTEKQYKISMTAGHLHKTVQKFPDRYFLFGVFSHDQLVAASIAIKITKNILYDFYHDHASAFDHASPVVFLIDGIYSFCLRNNIHWLDLGTSSIGSSPNFGLLTFKTRIGGQQTPKYTFEKNLD